MSTPREELNRLIAGFWTTQAIYVAVRLRVPDLLANGPSSSRVAQLASSCVRSIGNMKLTANLVSRPHFGFGVRSKCPMPSAHRFFKPVPSKRARINCNFSMSVRTNFLAVTAGFHGGCVTI